MPRLRRHARSLVFDAGAADDLVQTALERALTHWHQFDQRRDILVWTLSIAHNAHIDERRRHARMSPTGRPKGEYRSAQHEGTPVSLVEPVDAGAPPHDHLDRWGNDPGVDVGLRIDLVAALQHLPAEQREALLRVSVEQFSYAECAEALAIPIGSVMSRVSRARAVLRSLLEGRTPGSAAGAASGPPTLRRVI